MTAIETKLVLRSILAGALAFGIHSVVGCASEEHPRLGSGAEPGTGGYGNPDASQGNGGAATGGSTGGTGTGGSTGGGGSTGDASACVPPATLLDLGGFSKCTPSDGGVGPTCTDGYCVAITLMTAVGVGQTQLDLLANCDSTSKCVPGKFVQYQNKFTLKTCTSVAGAEGRCLSECIPQVSSQASFLPKDICGDGELCAPCYDPRTGADTQACHQGCDTGPTKPAVQFASCCGGNGSCVPTSVVPSQYVSLLGADTCTNAGDLCAPTKFQDLTYKPPACNSVGGFEGRCIPDCIPQVAAQKSFLPQDTCSAGELCAPCINPITGAATGACTIAGDHPSSDAPATFPGCCGGLGHCVPSTILSSSQQSLLGKDSCTNTGDLCAPDVFADVTQKPQSCRALGTFDAEGRCVPSCVPSVAAQASRLDQSTCSAGYLCAPCYDPLTGASTGACSQNGDAPVETAKTFPGCCGTLGLCVPTALVPANQVSQLGKDTCTGTDVLCAPKSLTDPTAKPPTCTTMSPLNLEGRCVPGCLPAVQSFASNLRQETCASGELCAPCYNPIDGTNTNACTINGDSPVNAAVQFVTCGSGQGLCVPSQLVPANLLSAVPKDTCGTGLLCAPADKVKNINFKYPACTGGLGAGACVPKYLALYAGGDPISQLAAAAFATCASMGVTGLPAGNDWLCAPCTNPLNQQPTGACL